MSYDISFVYSDGAQTETAGLVPIINKIELALFFNSLPHEVDKMDVIYQTVGIACMEAKGIAKQRLENRKAIQASM